MQSWQVSPPFHFCYVLTSGYISPFYEWCANPCSGVPCSVTVIFFKAKFALWGHTLLHFRRSPSLRSRVLYDVFYGMGNRIFWTPAIDRYNKSRERAVSFSRASSFVCTACLFLIGYVTWILTVCFSRSQQLLVEDIPDLVAALLLIVADPSTSLPLQRDITTAINQICNSIGPEGEVFSEIVS